MTPTYRAQCQKRLCYKPATGQASNATQYLVLTNPRSGQPETWHVCSACSQKLQIAAGLIEKPVAVKKRKARPAA